MQAGATLVPMDAKITQIGRLAQDPAPVFRNEGAAIPATDPALDYIQLTAKTLGTIVVASIEVLKTHRTLRRSSTTRWLRPWHWRLTRRPCSASLAQQAARMKERHTHSRHRTRKAC